MQQYRFRIAGAFFQVLLLVRPSLHISQYEKYLVLLKQSFFYTSDAIPITLPKGFKH